MRAMIWLVLPALLCPAGAGAETVLTKWTMTSGAIRASASPVTVAGLLGELFAAYDSSGGLEVYSGFRSPELGDVLDVAEAVVRTGHFMRQNSPNPVRGTTTFCFGLPGQQSVRLAIYDMSGRRVRDVVRGTLPAGVHDVTWNLDAGDGTRLRSGVYVYRLEAGSFRASRKLVIVN